MKIAILGLIFASVSFLGFRIGGKFKEKEKFYYDFKNFLIYLKSEIGFFKKDIVEIVDNFSTKNFHLNELLQNYKQSLIDKKFNKINILNDEENDKLKKFFDGIGVSDCDSQTEYVEKNLEIFGKKYEEAKIENLKKGNMYKKLSILIGILICVVLV
ncbi:MAG: stage III sporulation protein AB [Christensenellales bacterium]